MIIHTSDYHMGPAIAGPVTDALLKGNPMNAKQWLQDLSIPQLRALACQRGLADWKTRKCAKLIDELSEIDDIQVPVQV